MGGHKATYKMVNWYFFLSTKGFFFPGAMCTNISCWTVDKLCYRCGISADSWSGMTQRLNSVIIGGGNGGAGGRGAWPPYFFRAGTPTFALCQLKQCDKSTLHVFTSFPSQNYARFIQLLSFSVTILPIFRCCSFKFAMFHALVCH